MAIRSQQWKKVIEKLETLGVETYYPMRTIWRKRRGGPRERRDYPLIPSYLFVACDLRAISARSILSTRGVMCFLGVEGVPSVCDEGDITRMRHSERRGDYDETSRLIEQLIVGHVVPVQDGALAGWNVRIKAINGDTISADVDMFGKTHEVLISVDNLVKPH